MISCVQSVFKDLDHIPYKPLVYKLSLTEVLITASQALSMRKSICTMIKCHNKLIPINAMIDKVLASKPFQGESCLCWISFQVQYRFQSETERTFLLTVITSNDWNVTISIFPALTFNS